MKRRKSVFLVDTYLTDITGTKLPSVGQVLRFFLHDVNQSGQNQRDSANKTYNKVKLFWDRARIPTALKCNIVKKIIGLYNKWTSLKKSKRRSQTQIANENAFKKSLPCLFDIAHKNALQMITIEEDRKFLISQRQEGRVGHMGSVDKNLTRKEQQKKVRDEQRRASVAAEGKRLEERSRLVQLASSSDDNGGTSSSSSEGKTLKRRRSRSRQTENVPEKRLKNIANPKLVAILDRTGVSNRAATSIIAATSSAIGESVSKLPLSKSTIHRQRRKIRKEQFLKIKHEFSENAMTPLTVHWDGKLLPNLSGKEKSDRLPIIVTGVKTEKLLNVPSLKSGTGKNQADAVYNTLEDWNLCEKVGAMSFDTTATNTGKHKGACVLLENKLKKSLLYCACRHHIPELMLGAVYCTCLGEKKGPEDELCKRFQNSWPQIDKSQIKTCSSDQQFSSVLADQKREIVEFAEHQLNVSKFYFFIH